MAEESKQVVVGVVVVGVVVVVGREDEDVGIGKVKEEGKKSKRKMTAMIEPHEEAVVMEREHVGGRVGISGAKVSFR